jgi:uncharacterized phage protein (TIGR02216 family)
MSARFADAAARLAGLSGAALGWRPDEFWRATPAELAGIVAALRGGGGETETPPERSEIARLMMQFPD